MSSFYPFNPALGQQMQTAANGVLVDRSFVAHLTIASASAGAADTDAVRAAEAPGTDTGIDSTSGITNPPVPRNITATAGGTAGDIKAVQVTVHGTNYNDEVISETLPAFTADTPGTVTGSKCFKTVTRVVVPAMDGAGATVSIGYGDKFGLPHKLAHNTVLAAYMNHTKEGTLPTVTVSAADLESNGFTPNTTPNGSQIDLYYLV